MVVPPAFFTNESHSFHIYKIHPEVLHKSRKAVIFVWKRDFYEWKKVDLVGGVWGALGVDFKRIE